MVARGSTWVMTLARLRVRSTDGRSSPRSTSLPRVAGSLTNRPSRSVRVITPMRLSSRTTGMSRWRWLMISFWMSASVPLSGRVATSVVM